MMKLYYSFAVAFLAVLGIYSVITAETTGGRAIALAFLLFNVSMGIWVYRRRSRPATKLDYSRPERKPSRYDDELRIGIGPELFTLIVTCVSVYFLHRAMPEQKILGVVVASVVGIAVMTPFNWARISRGWDFDEVIKRSLIALLGGYMYWMFVWGLPR